jgi:hypothetical protein
VAFLDGDDVRLPTKTEAQVSFLRANCRGLVAVDHMLMTEEGCVCLRPCAPPTYAEFLDGSP